MLMNLVRALKYNWQLQVISNQMLLLQVQHKSQILPKNKAKTFTNKTSNGEQYPEVFAGYLLTPQKCPNHKYVNDRTLIKKFDKKPIQIKQCRTD